MTVFVPCGLTIYAYYNVVYTSFLYGIAHVQLNLLIGLNFRQHKLIAKLALVHVL